MIFNPRRWLQAIGCVLLLASALAAQADTRAAWSPDGQSIAIALGDLRQSRQWLSFWDAKTERKRGADIVAAADYRFSSLAFSHNSQLLAVGRTRGKDGLVAQVFDARVGGQRLQVSLPNEASAEVLGFNVGDTLLILRLASGRVVAIALNTGLERSSFGTAAKAQLSADGRWLGLLDAGQLRVLDLNGQQQPLSLPVPGAVQFAFGVDGKTLAVLSPDGVVSWQLPDGRVLFRQALSPAPASLADTAMTYGSDQRSLVVRVGERLHVLDRGLGSQRKLIDGVEAGAPVLLADPLNRERFLVGGSRRLPLFWNVYFGGRQPFMLDSPRFRAAASTKDGQWLAAGAASSQGEAGFTKVWNQAGTMRLELPGATLSLGFIGPQLLAADDGRGRVVIWELPGKQLKGRVDNYCRDGESRVVGASEATGLMVLRCDLPDGSVVSELRDAKGALQQSWKQRAVAYSGDGRLIAFAVPEGVDLLRTLDWQHRPLNAPGAERVNFNADSQTILVGDDKTGGLYVFDQNRSLPRLSLALGFAGRMTAQAFTGDGNLIYATADSGLQKTPQPVRRWDLRDNSRKPVDFGGGHTSRIVAILPLPDGQRFYTVGEDNAALIWEADGRSRSL